jgi:hypothetical protein
MKGEITYYLALTWNIYITLNSNTLPRDECENISLSLTWETWRKQGIFQLGFLQKFELATTHIRNHYAGHSVFGLFCYACSMIRSVSFCEKFKAASGPRLRRWRHNFASSDRLTAVCSKIHTHLPVTSVTARRNSSVVEWLMARWFAFECLFYHAQIGSE